MSHQAFSSFTPAHTPDQLQALIERQFGSEVRSIERTDYGCINAVYFAELASGIECVIKVTPHERGFHRLQEEAWAFEQCRRVGVPAPEVLAVSLETEAFPEPYIITRRIAGQNGAQAALTEEERQAVFFQIGEYLARIHTITLSGFGLLRRQGGSFVGRFPSLQESLWNELDHGWWRQPLLECGLATAEQLDAVRSRFEQHRDLFAVERACLVYADAGLKNVVLDSAKVVAVVDMENVVAGEPVNDFDALHYQTEADFLSVQQGYGAPDLFDADFTRKMYLYRLLFAFPTLVEHFRRQNLARVTEVQERIRRLDAALDAF